MDKLLWPAEAAEMLGISVEHLRKQFVQTGRLRTMRISGRANGPMKLYRSDVVALLDACTFQATPPPAAGEASVTPIRNPVARPPKGRKRKQAS